MAQIDLLDSGLVGLPEIFNLLKKKQKTNHDICKAKHNKIRYACLKCFDSQLVPHSKYLYVCMHMSIVVSGWLINLNPNFIIVQLLIKKFNHKERQKLCPQ